MGDQGSMSRRAPDQGHPEESETQSNDSAPEEGSLESFVVMPIRNMGILKILISQLLVVGEAEALGSEEISRAGLNAGAFLHELIGTEKS